MKRTPFLQTPKLAALDRIRHGFFTREGGVSTGIYGTLNCGLGSDDAPELVVANRSRAMAALGLGPEALVAPYQIHSLRAVVVDEPWPHKQAAQADAVATARAGLALGVLSADCVPVLFADPQAGVVAAAHAGWKGALGGVLEAAIEAMNGLGASNDRIVAAIGPSIRQQSYEVGPEFQERFVGAGNFFKPASRAGHWMFDLPGYVADRLGRLGLGAVEDIGLDTVTDEKRLFSYRRGTLAGEPRYGRMLSAIALT